MKREGTTWDQPKFWGMTALPPVITHWVTCHPFIGGLAQAANRGFRPSSIVFDGQNVRWIFCRTYFT